MRYPVTRQVDCPVSMQRRVRRAVETFLAQEREDPVDGRREEREMIAELRRTGAMHPAAVL